MPPQVADSRTVTIPELTKALGISRGLAYQAARRGEFPTIRIGRRVLVPRDALDRMLSADAPTRSNDEADDDCA
jgi:excisionase family DNA binding protein